MYRLYGQRMPVALGQESSGMATVGLATGVAALEAYVLYKVWKSRGEKDWPWYLLGAAVGANILLKVIAAAKVGA